VAHRDWLAGLPHHHRLIPSPRPPTPGGVGAVEPALIGGLAAFGVPTAVAVPSVLLYRVLAHWLPVFVGWPVMRWLTDKDMI
jgi:glycosyltransferase 2 family protein